MQLQIHNSHSHVIIVRYYDTRNISYFSVPYARTNAYYNSFFPHMLRFWNSLPPTLAHAPSTSVFKRLIEFYV